MSATTVMSQAGAPEWGSLALVSYLPEPLGSFLTGLRGGLGKDHNPEAHITFLPPRVLTLPLDRAAAHVTERLSLVEPFEVELGQMHVFAETNMLYLDIRAGSNQLSALHAALNRGDLHADEDYEFIPHLTVSSPLAAVDVDSTLLRAEAAWSKCSFPRRFLVGEVVLLWQSGDRSEKDWVRQLTVPLGMARPSAGMLA